MDKTKIIDISKFNTITDWAKVKKAVDGIIIRVAFRGYGSGKISPDVKFADFATECNRHGIAWGMYFMSSAITVAEAENEAIYSVDMARKYSMPANMPIFIDSEDVDGTSAKRRSDALDKATRTKVVGAFIRKVNSLGYKGGIYCSDSWTRDMLNWNDVCNLGVNWLAKYGKNDGSVSTVLAKPCHMHQFTSKARIDGVSGNCDLSYCYIDLGAGKPAESVAETPKDVLAEEPQTNKHVPLNYKAGSKYKVAVDALTVRTKPYEKNGKAVLGSKLGTVTKGLVVTNGATMLCGGQIFMLIGMRGKIEKWVCADTGSKAYIK